MHMRGAFTLLEMLISTVLLSLVLLGLYGALNLQKNSNKHLFEYLGKALDADKGVMVLYRDIFQSDGNISIKNGEFDRLCLNNTSHSLHGLAQAKVCWIVLKENKALIRIEGNGYRLPLRMSDGVEIDEVMGPMELFDIQKDKKKVLVGLQQVNREPYVFLVQGIEPPPKRKKPAKDSNTSKKNNTNTNRSSTNKPNKNKQNPKNNGPKNEKPPAGQQPIDTESGIPPGMEPGAGPEGAALF